MMGSVTTRYALRSLRRHPRRTMLSVFGVAFGVGIGLLAAAWVRGQQTMMADAAAHGGLGHLRVVPEAYRASRDLDLRLADWRAELERLRATPGVREVSPHAQVRGLLGMGTRSAHVTLTGVDPRTEPRTLRYVRELAEGRYLGPNERGAIVIGASIARRLRAEVNDELVVTAVDDRGEMQTMLLVVVGIASTGSRDVDDTIAHVALADVERLSGRAGASDLTILLDDVHAIDAMKARIAAQLPPGDAVLTWLEASPDLRAGMAKGEGYMRATLFIVLLVVLLGVTSAQLTSVLERRKELAVLAALGMRARHLVAVLLTEGIALGLASGLGALAWSAPVVAHLAGEGVDLGATFGGGGGVALGGVLMEMRAYPSFGPWFFGAGLALAVVATSLASLYPAWFAARTDPAIALRVDR